MCAENINTKKGTASIFFFLLWNSSTCIVYCEIFSCTSNCYEMSDNNSKYEIEYM